MEYATVVADPPWDHESFPSLSTSVKRPGYKLPEDPDFNRRKPLPYPTMTVEEIKALPVGDLAASDAHLYLWTTNRYLRDAYEVVESWGFAFSAVLTWCKTPMGTGLGGAFAPNLEFILFARRGSLKHLTRLDTRWWNWPRMGNAHSRKPEAFLDVVERVSPGPYLEMFARRNRLGWDTWGNEALNHVEIA